jgi:amidohydrolase
MAHKHLWILALLAGLPAPAPGQPAVAQPALSAGIEAGASGIREKVVAWRRDFHQHPELSNREFRTSGIVADHLRALGLTVRAPVARTGVVGVLKGERPGPVVALRADMDALPVTEEVDLPFASKVRATYNGNEVGVMHACGHDLHTAILMGVAEVLAGMGENLPGTVVFIFQPAEEGAPEGEQGGAGLMIQEGALENPRPEAIFGLHVLPLPVGHIAYRPGAFMAAADSFRIEVRGRQTHGAQPWNGIDPIVTSSQIVLALQTLVSRQIDISRNPAVVSIGSIRGGVRFNIIPDLVELGGTIRTFDSAMQEDLHKRIRRTADMIAGASGASAQTAIVRINPVTYNDPELTERMAPTLKRVAGAEAVRVSAPLTVSEDFSMYEQKVPGLYFALGILPEGSPEAGAAPNHSPRFYADEGALIVGVRALANLAADYMLQAR